MSEAVPVTDKLQCYLCGAAGAIRIEDVEDGLFGVEGRWRIRECTRCDLWWLDPMPRPEALPVLYESYFTHEDEAEPRVQRFVRKVVSTSRFGGGKSLPGAILSRVGPLRELIDVEHMTLGPGPGRVLDVGCGNGRFLLRARTLGWEPFGVEPDERGASVAAKRLGSNVIHGTIESASFEPASFEAITLNHVVEHLVDPIATLQHSAGLLAPGGRIIITTPNVRSWGHRRFGASWLGLDPPRHIHLFSPRSLVRCAENARLEVVDVRTPARWAFWIWQTSATLKRRGVLPGADITGASVGLKAMAAMFWLTEYVASRVRPVGEEVLLIARRST